MKTHFLRGPPGSVKQRTSSRRQELILRFKLVLSVRSQTLQLIVSALIKGINNIRNYNLGFLTYCCPFRNVTISI